MAERLDKRRAGPGPEEGRARPRLEDPEDCLLVLMMSSKAISKAVVMFVERKRERERFRSERFGCESKRSRMKI